MFIFDLLSNTPIPLRTLKQMVDVAVEGGGISGDAYGGEGRWGEGLELATENGSEVVAVSLSLLEHCFALLSSRRIFQFLSYHLPCSIYRSLMPWKWVWLEVPRDGKGIVAVVLRMYLLWLDVMRMWW